MRTLNKREQGFNWDELTKALPLITIALLFACFVIVLGILQICSGNY